MKFVSYLNYSTADENTVFLFKSFNYYKFFHFIISSLRLYDAHLWTRRRWSSVFGKCRSVPPPFLFEETFLKQIAKCTEKCTIVFKKNGPPTNYNFQIHNTTHARLLEAPVHKMTQWNHINMLYFEIKYVIEWSEEFIIAASMLLKIEITIKVIYTNFIETCYKIYRNKINKKDK